MIDLYGTANECDMRRCLP